MTNVVNRDLLGIGIHFVHDTVIRSFNQRVENLERNRPN